MPAHDSHTFLLVEPDGSGAVLRVDPEQEPLPAASARLRARLQSDASGQDLQPRPEACGKATCDDPVVLTGGLMMGGSTTDLSDPVTNV